MPGQGAEIMLTGFEFCDEFSRYIGGEFGFWDKWWHRDFALFWMGVIFDNTGYLGIV
jgi:hypothetical protein